LCSKVGTREGKKPDEKKTERSKIERSQEPGQRKNNFGLRGSIIRRRRREAGLEGPIKKGKQRL